MINIKSFFENIENSAIEFKKIKEICNFLNREELRKTELISHGYPVINSGKNIYGFYSDYNNEGPAFVVATNGNSAGYVNFLNSKFWAGQLCLPYSSKDEKTVLTKFIYYYLKTIEKEIIIGKLVSRGGIPFLKKTVFEELEIPVPSIDIQKQIVGIIQLFEENISILKNVLELRIKQYEYYKYNILKEQNLKEYSICTIEDIAKEIIVGKDAPLDVIKGQKVPDMKHKYPVYSNGIGDNAIYGYCNNYTIKEDAVTISARGTVGHHEVRKKYFTPIVRLITIIPDATQVSAEFLNYALSTVDIKASSGGIKQITRPMIKKIKLAIPSLEEQTKIINTLNNFKFLINEQLPLLIELRTKQYEYYRNKLLTFDELTKE